MKQNSEKYIIRHVKGENRVLDFYIEERLEDAEFRPNVIRVLNTLLPDYDIVEYGKTIYWDRQPEIGHNPDFIMVSKSRRKWIIVEVELHHHPLGHSYSSPMNKRSDHIYPQVETFAEGIYTEEHISLLAKKLKEKNHILKHLLYSPPEILVIGDNQDVIRTNDELLNWKRLEEDFSNVHLGFLETYKWGKNQSDTCQSYTGWLPERKPIEKVRLIIDKNWPNSVRTIKDNNQLLFEGLSIKHSSSEEKIQILIEGIDSSWVYNNKYKVLSASCPLAIEWMENNRESKLFQIEIGDRVILKTVNS